MHDSSLELCQNFVRKHLDAIPTLRVADIGSMDIGGSYRRFFARPGWQYTGFDLEAGPNVDVLLKQPEDWALESQHIGAYDVVISGQVLEHVQRPWQWIHQVAALARKDGFVWVCAPNTAEYHAYPIDCWRVWPDGMKAIFEDAHLEIVECFMWAADTVGIGRKTGRSDGSSRNLTP